MTNVTDVITLSDDEDDVFAPPLSSSSLLDVRQIGGTTAEVDEHPMVTLRARRNRAVLRQPVNGAHGVLPQRRENVATSTNRKHLSHSSMAATSTKRSSSVPLKAPDTKKPYLPTAENGHAVPCVSASAIQHQRLTAFTEHYTEYVDLSKGPVEEKFAGHFKCTYNNCQKCIRNNVAFMYHLWAHVVRFKSHYEGVVTNMHLVNGANHVQSAAKDDVLRLRTCPECLLVLPNPYRMHLHYHRVHKREQVQNTPELSVCNVCESVVLTEGFEDHIRMKHKAGEAPFWCRRCRYRTSTRYALLKHFAEEHCGSSMLVCPFCTVVFNVPANERNRAFATATSYVQHVLDHDIENNQQCSGCSTKFSEDLPDIMQEKLERHARAHAESISNTWTKRTKPFASVLDKPKSTVIEDGRGPKVCAECSEVVHDPQEHFGKLMKCAVHYEGCEYETACKASFNMHEKLGVCRPQNLRRLGRANLFVPHTSLVEVLRCTKDDFHTTDGGKMAKHSLKCGAEVIVSTASSGPHIVGNEHSEGYGHIDEAKMFGPHKPTKPPTEPSLEAVDEKILKLRELLPVAMVKEALKTLKPAFGEVDESCAKEMQMRLASSR